MANIRAAIVGVGATGSVLAAALLTRNPDTILVVRSQAAAERLLSEGIEVSGALELAARPQKVLHRIADLKDAEPEAVFLATKTFALAQVLDELAGIHRPGMKIVSTHNGLGTEDLIAERLEPLAAFRMSLNFGVGLSGPGRVSCGFFNRPNYLGCVDPASRQAGQEMAAEFSLAGLETQFVDDIKLYIWRKMVMKCTMASICAVTDRTIGSALDFPPTREIADACFGEVLAVAKAMGYDLGKGYMEQVMQYLSQARQHKDSMCVDIANQTPTEIDFLGGKVVEYGRQKGVATPFYIAMTNLVRAMEDGYLNR